jgi:RND family efflux transporter MFP subunit
MNRFVTRFLIPVALIGAGVVGAKTLIASKDTVEPAPVESAAPPVEVLQATRSMHTPSVRATGVVEAARTVRVTPQVGGRLVAIAPELVVGGRVTAGQTLARIDRSEYSLALRTEQAALAQAEVEVELESGRGRAAQREWSRYGDGSSQGRIAKREPQLAAAEASVAARKVAIERARLNLSRTTIKAPFNAAVVEESAEVGQVVGVASNLATLVGTDEVWIRVAVPPESLRHIHYADEPGQTASVVMVSQSLGRGGDVRWEGKALRLLSELDTESRSAQVLVAVSDPLAANPEMPLLPGAFVSVEIRAATPQPAIEIPRLAVFDGNQAWRVDADTRLEKVELQVGWADDDHVYVHGGIAAGDAIVLREPPRAVLGMPVVPRSSGDTAAENDDRGANETSGSGGTREEGKAQP